MNRRSDRLQGTSSRFSTGVVVSRALSWARRRGPAACLGVCLSLGAAQAAGPIPGEAPDSLYERLAAARDKQEAGRIEAAIKRLWQRSGSPTADLLLNRARTALGHDDAPLAIELLDRTIALAPDWPEAYALRGQIFAAIGDDERAAADFNQVLAQNQRHFIVLATLADIFERAGARKGALTLYERALALNPHIEDVRKAHDRLRLRVEGRPL